MPHIKCPTHGIVGLCKGAKPICPLCGQDEETKAEAPAAEEGSDDEEGARARKGPHKARRGRARPKK